MAVGQSGRIVIEINPALKRDLYQALRLDGKNLKDWFLGHAEHYIGGRSSQIELFPSKENEGNP